jgi:Flp pilus assembly protein TadD
MLSLGAALMEQDKNDQALAWFRKALSIDATDSRIINNLGIVLQRLGRIEEALAVYHQGLDLDPDNARLHNGLGLALLDRGQYEEAARHLQQATDIDPGLTEAYVNLGLTAEHQGEIARAAAFYRQALEIDPSYDLARWNLALLYIKEGRTHEAAALAREADVIKPEQRPLINRLILALAEQQSLAPALELAEKLASALPDDPVIHYNLACLHARLNHPKEALAHLKTAVDLGYDRWDHLRLDPDFKIIHHTEYFKHLVRRQTP